MKTLQQEVKEHPVYEYLVNLNDETRPTMAIALRRFLAASAECGFQEIPPEYLFSEDCKINFSNLTAGKLEKVIYKLLKMRKPNGKPYSKRTAALTITAVRGVMKKCKRLKLIPADDFIDLMDVDLPEIPKDSASRRFLEPKEEEAILSACKEDKSPWGVRDRAIFSWMLSNGPRCAEVVNAELQHYDPETGKLFIKSGKGNKDRWNILSNGYKAAMDAWLKVRGDQPGALFCGIKFFEATLSYDHMIPFSINKIIEKRARQAGVKLIKNGQRLTPHAFRRTAGEAIAYSKSFEVAATILGHSDINTTRQNYTRRKVNDALEAVAAMQG